MTKRLRVVHLLPFCFSKLNWKRNVISSRSKKFLSYYRPYIGLLLADVACALLVSVTLLLIPLCVRYITKQVLVDMTPQSVRQIYLVGALMLGLIVVQVLANTFVDYQGHSMGAMMERDMRRELFAHYQALSFGFYDGQRTGQLMTRLTNDSFWLSELYHHGPEDVIISLLNFVGAFAILLMINDRLALAVFLFLPVMAIFAVYFNRRMKRAMRISRDRIGDINAQVEDTLAGMRTVQSFTNEAVEAAKFERENGRFLQSRRAEYQSEAHYYGGMTLFTQLMPLAVVVFGGVAIARAQLDLPDLLTFLLYIGIAIEPIKRFSNFTSVYQQGMAGFDRFMEMLEVQPAIADTAVATPLTHVAGQITFDTVSFRYETDNRYVLDQLSLCIGAGEYVALVGASGVGKTTLCALIPRFYEVDAGSVCVDGRNIKTLTLHSLRQNIGIVQQDVYLFAGTVAENIGYGRVHATRADIVAAAKSAHAHDFIMALPHGYDTDIGQRGVKLSGGQKQRLSIARVFLKDPPILIFDEATSALDNESERAVQQAMEQLSHNRTTLVIAHRLSTIRNAQRIVVLADGGIAEQGQHAALLAQNGIYARLYNMQAKI